MELSEEFKNQMAKPGNSLNPWGRTGKDGTKGFSLKSSYKRWLKTLSPEEQNKMWNGLFLKAKRGDISAIKLFIELNDEVINTQRILPDELAGTTNQLIINMPAKEEVPALPQTEINKLGNE